MFKKVLIANRGEIAVRVIRACKEMGIKTVAVYSETDKYALHTNLADESICIGPAPSKDSYLNITNIISAAVLTNSEAIHPGFGFLSENAKFARICRECNIAFIGPSEDAIERMGNKSEARKTMINAGVPVVPGTKDKVESLEEGLKFAISAGFPVIIKASAGGGGKGMRVANDSEEFKRMFETAKAEAKAAFGDDTVYIEKFIDMPRHIEFQILADNYGNVIHLGERDCSLQRRNQKVIEEAPSIVLSNDLRKKMGETAVKAAKAVNYSNAGTIEFLLDKDNSFYFMEMNTRIQVEHPITEMITGVDLLKWQLKIASGEKLSLIQDDVKINGHAIECRINAENPKLGFRPSPGTVEYYYAPGGPGVRVDSAIYPGYIIPPTYDSMIAKIIVHADSRDEAIVRMKRALSELIIDGVDTNIDLHFTILENEKYKKGEIYTKFLENELLK